MNGPGSTQILASPEERAEAERLDAALATASSASSEALTRSFGSDAAHLATVAHSLFKSDPVTAPRSEYVSWLEGRVAEAFEARPVPVPRWVSAAARSRVGEVMAVGALALVLAAGAFLMTGRNDDGAVATAVAATETATPTEPAAPSAASGPRTAPIDRPSPSVAGPMVSRAVPNRSTAHADPVAGRPADHSLDAVVLQATPQAGGIR